LNFDDSLLPSKNIVTTHPVFCRFALPNCGLKCFSVGGAFMPTFFKSDFMKQYIFSLMHVVMWWA